MDANSRLSALTVFLYDYVKGEGVKLRPKSRHFGFVERIRPNTILTHTLYNNIRKSVSQNRNSLWNYTYPFITATVMKFTFLTSVNFSFKLHY